jgi:hypothetical protein
MRSFAVLLVVLLLVIVVEAGDIMINPDELYFEAEEGVYAENILEITTESTELVHVLISKPELFDKWFIIEDESVFVRDDKPAEVNIAVNPARKGFFETYLIVSTLENRENSSMVDSIPVKTMIKVKEKSRNYTDDEDEEIPLSLNWMMLLFWTGVLIFVTLLISKYEEREN